jgi:hypothetical protein
LRYGISSDRDRGGEEAAAMKRISKDQRDARKHNTEESGESFRKAAKAVKKSEPKSDKKEKGAPTQDHPSKINKD